MAKYRQKSERKKKWFSIACRTHICGFFWGMKMEEERGRSGIREANLCFLSKKKKKRRKV